MNSQKIEKKIKISWIAGLLFGVVILILAVLSVLNINFFLNVGYTVSSFIDVIVVFSLTYGIYRKSRVCAILMLVYVLLNQLYASIQTGQWSMGFLTILLIWIFSDGIRALFEYHKINPNKKVSSGQVAVKSFAIFVAALVTFFIYVGIRSSYLKSQNQILNSSNLDIKITKALTDAELIEKGEKILFFYSNKLVNKEKSFIFISDRKLVIHLENFNEGTVLIKNDDIEEVKLIDNELLSRSGMIQIILKDSTDYWFPITKNNNYDERVYRNIRDVLHKNEPNILPKLNG